MDKRRRPWGKTTTKRTIKFADERTRRVTSLVREPQLLSNRLSGPFPVRKSCQLVYTGQANMSIPVTSTGVYQWSCNGLYDPDITGTGSQPMYFDQLMALYNHYVVTSSYIELQFVGNITKDLVCTLYVEDDTTTGSTNAVKSGMRPGAKMITANVNVDKPTPMTIGWNAYRNFGPNVLNNELFRGSASSNPTEEMYFTLKCDNLQLDAITVPFIAKVTYNVTFTELKTITES